MLRDPKAWSLSPNFITSTSPDISATCVTRICLGKVGDLLRVRWCHGEDSEF